MITNTLIKEILLLYKKHGWNISRVLLSAEVENSLSKEEKETFFGDLEIINAEVDAVWFSRPSKHRKTAWELRHLIETPFALFELFDEETDELFKIEKLKELENRLVNHASNK